MNNKQIIRKLKNLPAGIEIFRDLNSDGSIMNRSTIVREYSLTELKGLIAHKANRYFQEEPQDHEAHETLGNYVEIIFDKYELEYEAY